MVSRTGITRVTRRDYSKTICTLKTVATDFIANRGKRSVFGTKFNSYLHGLFKNHLHSKNRCHRFYRKPWKAVGFWYKIQFLKFGKNMKAERVFWFIERFLTDFFIQNSNFE
jgi:hypothetical protein